jgi:hypothetical protein
MGRERVIRKRDLWERLCRGLRWVGVYRPGIRSLCGCKLCEDPVQPAILHTLIISEDEPLSMMIVEGCTRTLASEYGPLERTTAGS